MICSNCGTQLPGTAKFCAQCGSRINVASPVVSNSISSAKNYVSQKSQQLTSQSNIGSHNQNNSSLNLDTVRCPRCNEVLSTEDGLDVIFCKYCRTIITLSEQSGPKNNANNVTQENRKKSNTKHTLYEYMKERIREAQYNYILYFE